MVFLINSNKKYYQIAAPVLIKSLVDSGVDKRNIVVIVGGCESPMTITIDNVQHHMVEYDSFDMNAFIYVVENNVDFGSFFYLHDTCEVGKNFYKYVVAKLEKHKPTKCMPLKGGSSMNIGWYDVTTIKQYKGRIIDQKNLDLSEKSMYKAKREAVDNEDHVIHLIGGRTDKFTTKDAIITKMTQLYGDTTERRCEFYDEIDLKKYKRSWARSPKYAINL